MRLTCAVSLEARKSFLGGVDGLSFGTENELFLWMPGLLEKLLTPSENLRFAHCLICADD